MTIQGWDSMILFYIGRIIVEWSCQIKKADDPVDGFLRLFGNCVKVIFNIVLLVDRFLWEINAMFAPGSNKITFRTISKR